MWNLNEVKLNVIVDEVPVVNIETNQNLQICNHIVILLASAKAVSSKVFLDTVKSQINVSDHISHQCIAGVEM